MMKARFLEKDEDTQWFECLGQTGEKFTGDPDFRPHHHIVVEESGRFVGCLEIASEPPLMAILLNPVVRTRIRPGEILSQMITKAISVVQRERLPKIRLMFFDRTQNPAPMTQSLVALGFVWAMTKRVYHLRQPFQVARPELLEQIELRSLAQLGQEPFLEIYRRAFTPDTQIEPIAAEDDFGELTTFAVNTKAYDPGTWLAAFHRGRAIGITLPQRHDTQNNVGSNFYLAVVEHERAHGFGFALQYAAIERLVKLGVTDIIGSTNIENRPMARIFSRLGYEPTMLQEIYYYRPRSKLQHRSPKKS